MRNRIILRKLVDCTTFERDITDFHISRYGGSKPCPWANTQLSTYLFSPFVWYKLESKQLRDPPLLQQSYKKRTVCRISKSRIVHIATSLVEHSSFFFLNELVLAHRGYKNGLQRCFLYVSVWKLDYCECAEWSRFGGKGVQCVVPQYLVSNNWLSNPQCRWMQIHWSSFSTFLI